MRGGTKENEKEKKKGGKEREKKEKKKKKKTYMHINFLLLIQRNKLNVRTRTSIIQKRPLNGIQIMSPNRNKSPPPANIMMKLVLKINEALVRLWCESNISENSTQHHGANIGSGGGGFHDNSLSGGGDGFEGRGLLEMKEIRGRKGEEKEESKEEKKKDLPPIQGRHEGSG